MRNRSFKKRKRGELLEEGEKRFMLNDDDDDVLRRERH